MSILIGCLFSPQSKRLTEKPFMSRRLERFRQVIQLGKKGYFSVFLLLLMMYETAVAKNEAPVICEDASYFGQGFVFVGRPDGTLWQATHSGWRKLPPTPAWTQFSVTPDGVIYLYHYPDKLYRSVDHGNSWEDRNLPPTGSFRLEATPATDTLFFAAIIENYSTLVIYKSSDGGVTWKQVILYSYLTQRWLTISPNFVNDGTAFVVLLPYHAEGFTMLRSTDFGETWMEVHHTLPTTALLNNSKGLGISPQFATDQTVFAAALSGFYKSSNAGESWQYISNYEFGPTSALFSPNFADDQTLMIAHNRGGLYLSLDGGKSVHTLWGSTNNTVVSAYGLRWQLPVAEASVPITTTPQAIQTYLPLIGSSRNPSQLEFWAIATKEQSGDCFLYRSLGYGSNWQEITSFE